MECDSGAVGRAVASDNRYTRFESSPQQFYILSTVLNKQHRKDDK